MSPHRYLPLLAAFMLSSLTVRADEAIPRGPLPDDVRPTAYRLQLDVDPGKTEFSGVAEIDVEVARPVRTIWLHGHGLKVRTVTVGGAASTPSATYEEVEPLSGVARVRLSAELPAGHATLRFDYAGALRDSPDGLYHVKVGDDWYVYSQLEALDARRVFPGFDEPRFKTPFTIKVMTPSANRVVSNAALARTEPAPGGKVRHVFQPTLPLPTYLLAFAVGPFDIVDATVPPNAIRAAPLALRGVTTRGRGRDLAFAMKHTPEIVSALEDWFAIPYPYPKLDIIASPVHLGAMENAGAIIFNDEYLLLDDAARPSQQDSYYVTVAHEVAHHWFGDLVTPAWWDDIWLNESFAEWMGVKIADRLRPDLGSRAGEFQGITYAMDVDSKRAGRPIHQAVKDNSEVESTFDAITYMKGGSVLAMVESYLGEETFRQGVQLHLRRHEHGVATSEQFFAALAEAARQPPVIAAFRSFVDQPGVPLISVARSADDATGLTVTQDRYLPIGSTLTGGQLWQVPLCIHSYAGGASPAKTCSLLSQRSGAISVPAGTTAFMPNAGGAGYYRFAVAGPGLDALLAAAGQLPETEAIVLADSVAAAFRAGRLPASQLLEAAQGLSGQKNRIAATLLADQLTDIRDRWTDAATRPGLEARIRTIYGPRLAELGLDPRRGVYATEQIERRRLRARLAMYVAMWGRDPGLRGKLAEAAKASLDDPAALDTEFRPLAWAVGVQELGDAFAQQLEARMLGSQDGALRGDAAWGLGNAEDAKTAARARDLSTRPDVRPDELARILYPQFLSPVTRDAAWTWLQDNFDRVLGKMPGIFRTQYFQVLEPFCDAPHRTEIAKALDEQVRKLGSGELDMQRTLEGIDLCIAQRAALGPSVTAALGTQ